MSEIVFQNEPLTEELIHDVSNYAVDHLKEIGHPGNMEPDVWFEWYNSASDMGGLRIFTARNGKLVGYAVFFVSPHRHHRGVMQATQDLVYLAPEARKGLTGVAFLKWCDEQLKKEGVGVVYQYSSTSRDIGPVLSRMGYENIQTMWMRRLNGGTN